MNLKKKTLNFPTFCSKVGAKFHAKCAIYGCLPCLWYSTGLASRPPVRENVLDTAGPPISLHTTRMTLQITDSYEDRLVQKQELILRITFLLSLLHPTPHMYIWLNICAFPHILGNHSSYVYDFAPIASEFPYTVYEENFLFFFYQCTLPPSINTVRNGFLTISLPSLCVACRGFARWRWG
jgi:hypothetical protein